MTMYRPILKAKAGEFEAIAHLPLGDFNSLTPILEICPEADHAKAVEKVSKNLAKFVPAGITLGLDASRLPHTVGNSVPSEKLANELAARGVGVLPVLLLSASTSEIVSAGQVASAGMGEVVLRVPLSVNLGAGLDLALLGSVTAQIGLPLASMQLLLDLGDVETSDVAAAVAEAERAIQQAVSLGTWSSVTVAAGAFPDSISHLSAGQRTTLPRADSEIWRELTKRGWQIDFADYAVNHPSMPSQGAMRGPLPSLRYTFEREWVIWRERRNRPGNESFFDLCKKVIRDRAWAGSGFSWGDSEIALKAAEISAGPGGATQWRAYGTSHHIRTVLNRLATLGEP